MTAPEIETLTALDWNDYACQCPVCGPCDNRATHIVEIHAIGRCNNPGLNDYGNRIEIRCYECVVRLFAYLTEQLQRLNSRYHYCECESCGAPIENPRDIVREVVPLS